VWLPSKFEHRIITDICRLKLEAVICITGYQSIGYSNDFGLRKINPSEIIPANRRRSGPNLLYICRSMRRKLSGNFKCAPPSGGNGGRTSLAQSEFFCVTFKRPIFTKCGHDTCIHVPPSKNFEKDIRKFSVRGHLLQS